MPDVYLTLGAVVFDGLEIPAEIEGGGDQALKVHKLPGGARVVDAMGRDDKPLAWSGRFQSSDAEDRANAVDAIRNAGLPVLLTWGSRSFQVVVESFTWRWQRFYQIVYSISCVVVTDNSEPPDQSTPTLDDLVGGDMASISDIMPSITDASVGSAIGGLQGAIAAVGNLQGAALSALGPVAAAAQSAKGVISGVLSTMDAATQSNAGSVAGIVAGGFAPAMISTFTAQSGLIDQQWRLQQVSSLVDRVATNIANATG